jgi:tight adherence protein C
LLTEAGLPESEEHVAQFLAKRVATGLVIGSLLFVAALVLMPGLLSLALFGLLGGFMIGSLIPQFGLKAQATRRKTELRYTMPDTLDLMVVCVEAGLGLDATIQKVAEETERMAPEISHEFKRLNKELSAGISRIEAFQNLGHRAGVDELRSLCAMIIQADKMGTSVSDTLRVFADDLRTKRRQKAEELASKASIKMTFPLVFFIFPPLFIILMGPMIIQTINHFFPQQ